MNVREKTEVSSRKVKTIARKGTEVHVIGEATDSENVRWYQISTKEGKIGYIRSDMMELEDPAAAPAEADASRPKAGDSSGSRNSGADLPGNLVRLIEKMATRCGPSTTFCDFGTYQMKGEAVTALSKAYDNGGVLWIEVMFTYHGGYRRAWTGAKRLDISDALLARLPSVNADYILGRGTITQRITPSYGPGSTYSEFTKKTFEAGEQVTVVSAENSYYLVECEYTDGHTLRCWVPIPYVQIN